MQPEPSATLPPPPSPPRIATGYEGDDIEDLGERIVSLDSEAVRRLREYLKPVLEGE